MEHLRLVLELEGCVLGGVGELRPVFVGGARAQSETQDEHGRVPVAAASGERDIDANWGVRIFCASLV